MSFQALFSAGRALAFSEEGQGEFIVRDAGLDPSSPWGFIYTPRGNSSGQMAVKAGLLSSVATDVEVHLLERDGSSEVLASSISIDPESEYSGFDNSLALSDNGTVAVVARRAADNARVVLRIQDGEVAEVAAVGSDGLADIHFFAPDVNDAGQVVFRGDDADGQAVFVADGESLVRVAGNGDYVQTDLGEGQLGQHDTSPVFGGAPRINAGGDVSFAAGIHPAGDNQVEWGSGVFVAYAEQEPEPPVQVQIDRLEGGDRYEVAAAISGRLEPGVPLAIVVGGGDYADALVAAAPAGAEQAPVLLTRDDHLPAVTAAELARLQPAHVVVVGGTTSVNEAVVDLIALAAGTDVTRVAGEDRFEVARNVADHFSIDSDVVYVASGDTFADALTGSARAGATGAAVLLTRADRLPQDTRTALTALNPEQIRILGGPASVSAGVAADLAEYGQVTRVEGEDRYEVAVQLAQAYETADTIYLASGLQWPDALAGAALAAATDRPLLLVKDGEDGSNPVPAVIATELLRLDPTQLWLFGGELTLPTDVEDALVSVFDSVDPESRSN